MKYQALRTISTIYRVLGFVTAAIGVLVVIGTLCSGVVGGAGTMGAARGLQEFGTTPGLGAIGMLGGIVGALIMAILEVLYFGLIALTLFAFAEGIQVILDLEANTRRTAELLASTQQAQQRPQQG
jgi:hypothetical protein